MPVFQQPIKEVFSVQVSLTKKKLMLRTEVPLSALLVLGITSLSFYFVRRKKSNLSESIFSYRTAVEIFRWFL